MHQDTLASAACALAPRCMPGPVVPGALRWRSAEPSSPAGGNPYSPEPATTRSLRGGVRRLRGLLASNANGTSSKRRRRRATGSKGSMARPGPSRRCPRKHLPAYGSRWGSNLPASPAAAVAPLHKGCGGAGLAARGAAGWAGPARRDRQRPLRGRRRPRAGLGDAVTWSRRLSGAERLPSGVWCVFAVIKCETLPECGNGRSVLRGVCDESCPLSAGTAETGCTASAAARRARGFRSVPVGTGAGRGTGRCGQCCCGACPLSLCCTGCSET